MKKRDQLPEPVDLMKLPCVKCGGKATRLIRVIGECHLPCCSDHNFYVAELKNCFAMEKLAQGIDMLAGAGDIIACQTLIARKRRDVFGDAP